ncbi:MAG: hypothetical protein ABI720_06480, partial [Actinomycetes bacterium]
MRVIQRSALLAAVAAVVLIPSLPASAAAAPLPETVLKVKTIDWQPRTGNVEVTARVKCTGKGSFQWGVALEQRVRARNSSNVPCDGDGYRSTLVLDPRNGRFHPGPAVMTTEQIILGEDVGIGSALLERIRISPP